MERDAAGKWQKGTSGNPGGKPVGAVSLVGALRRYLAEHPDQAQAIIAKTVKDALEGDVQARKLVFDRIDGGVQQAVDLTSKGEFLGKAIVGVDIDKDL